jgi:uncharacterized protein (DUF2147 family)
MVVFARGIGSLAITLASVGGAVAASSPIGVWIDHTGRGAVEIIDCGGKLCGHLVWFKDAKQGKGGATSRSSGMCDPLRATNGTGAG